jgi:trigger factor
MEDAINDMIPDAYDEAIKEQDLKPIAQPEIELTQTEPVIFKAVVPLAPVVTLGDYKTIRIEPQEANVSEEEVEHVIEHLQHQNATWEPVERPVQLNDMVIIDVKSQVEGNDFLNRDGIQYAVEEGTNFPAPGFGEHLPGMNRGDEKEFNIHLPEDYARKEFAGKEATFKVTINEIKLEKLPEINDDFAKTVSSECPDMTALRATILKDMKAREEDRVKSEYDDKVIDALINMSKLEYPPVIVEREVTRLLNQQLQYMQMSGINLEEYMKTIKKTPEDMRKDLQPRAEKRVKQTLVLSKLGEDEKVEVSHEEIDAEIEILLKSTPENQQEEAKSQLESSHESIKDMLVIRKALKQLAEIAKTSNTENKEAETKEKEEKNG